ncbi:hypothetical protein LZ30DRAFT_587576 [Colletotrichum cereale]|nr:hypothetical protein LZ30DRAFT_587576 [Colletotrichum cereale]
MENSPVKHSQVDVKPRRASSAYLSEHRSNVDSVQGAKDQSSANTTVKSAKDTNGRSVRSVFKASWGKTVSKILGKQARPGITLEEKAASGPDAVNKKGSGFSERWDKRFEELLNRSDPLKFQSSKSVTDVNVASSYHDKNKGLLKRRSLGNIFGSARSRNTPKKVSKSPEALAKTMDSSPSTQSLAKDTTTSDSAPPMLPHLPPSGDFRSSIQMNLEADPDKSSIDPSAQHLRSSTPTRPHQRDQAVQTPLTSITEHTNAKEKETYNLSLPGMVDLHTGHELVWNTSTNHDALSVPKCNTMASGSIAKPHLCRTRSETEVTKQLVRVSPTNDTVDSAHTTRTRDLQIPRIGRQQEVRRSLKGDQVHIYSDRKIFWIPEAKNQSMGEASASVATARNVTINHAIAGTDMTNMPSDFGSKNLKRKAKSLTFVRQLEIQPRGSSLTAPRRMSFKMDLRGTDSGPDDPKSSLRGNSDDDD